MKSLFTVILTLMLMSCSEQKDGTGERQESVSVVAPVEPVNGAAEIALTPFLSDALVQLKGDEFVLVSEFVPPTKYYVFYETASWCAPCQKFVSTLVAFYDLYKEIYGAEFEIIVISYDADEDAMQQAAVEKGMLFPHLELAQVSELKQKFPALGAALPNLIVTDLDGNVMRSAISKNGDYYGPTVAMNYLKAQLDKK